MITLIDSMSLIVAVLGIALLGWLIRTVADSQPDRFLLNFAFFAFAGQCVLTAETVRVGNLPTILIGLLLVGVIVLLVNVFVIRAQTLTTLEHYRRLLEQHALGQVTQGEIERWAVTLLLITGVDFFPEFYTGMSYRSSKGPHSKRRTRAVSILPPTQFNCGVDGVSADSLLVPQQGRLILWRSYVFTSLLSWMIFIVSILIARRS
jgi:hypothetical protein